MADGEQSNGDRTAPHPLFSLSLSSERGFTKISLSLRVCVGVGAMSTAREDAQEGGVGGKLRTRQTRRVQATPYDRPAAGLRGDAAERRGNRWISKVVDPASTLITKGATRLLSSVFGKRLGAPPVEESPVVTVEQREATSDVCGTNYFPEIENQGSKYKDDSRSYLDGDDISELDLLLKQKTFTRAEYEHLMELLHSRTVDALKEDENKRNDPSTSLPAYDYKKQDGNLLPQESRIGSYKFTGITSIPGPTSKGI
ncbi:hypothetical protein Taro_045712 [Colocasia esculenta]|uniref:Uncharacterized protein n=1 Tax=Colocasia esculenta TaxID=4460 RepID=A0A843X359_COLES|nr:hypothetical protein [Colocasia esculenta]